MKAATVQKAITFAAVLCLAFTAQAWAQRTKSSLSAGEQRYAEKGLKDNRYFFYFINSSVSNLGSEEEKALYKEAIQRDLIAQLLYMKFLFHESFVEIKRSQKILIDLYRKTLTRDIQTARELLGNFARPAIKTDRYRSQHYLKLGYRDLAHARIIFRMADHYRENLYSMRLYEYVKAIKTIKQGRRYAFLSGLESASPSADYKEWGLLSFDELDKKIGEIAPEKKDYHSIIHYDNHYRARDELSFFDRIWLEPRLEEIPEYAVYLEMK
jgi:hypothetical protein